VKRIAIDMDDTTVDTSGAIITAYNSTFGASMTKADLGGGYLPELLKGERRSWVEALLGDERFFRHLPLIEGSARTVEALAQRYEVYITTAAMEVPRSFGAKFEWLREHFPFVAPSHIVFCGDKSVLAVDYMIDDQPRHFERFGGKAVLFTAPHNLGESRYLRVDTWAEVERMFLQNDATRTP
jgi:5'(3')-deoxyribonucleotidase